MIILEMNALHAISICIQHWVYEENKIKHKKFIDHLSCLIKKKSNVYYFKKLYDDYFVETFQNFNNVPKIFFSSLNDMANSLIYQEAIFGSCKQCKQHVVVASYFYSCGNYRDDYYDYAYVLHISCKSKNCSRHVLYSF